MPENSANLSASPCLALAVSGTIVSLAITGSKLFNVPSCFRGTSFYTDKDNEIYQQNRCCEFCCLRTSKLKQLLADVWQKESLPVKLYCDNQAAIASLSRPFLPKISFAANIFTRTAYEP